MSASPGSAAATGSELPLHPPHGAALPLQSRRRLGGELALLLAAGAAPLRLGLGRAPAIEPTDARDLEIARVMGASQDRPVPQLAGLRHLHKPPFTYWVGCLGYRVFGIGEFGGRVLHALAALATALLIRVGARRACTPQGARAASVAFPTFGLSFATSRGLCSDLFDLLFVTAALLLGLDALADRPRRRHALGAGLGLFARIGLSCYALRIAREPGLIGDFLEKQLLHRALGSGSEGYPHAPSTTPALRWAGRRAAPPRPNATRPRGPRAGVRGPWPRALPRRGRRAPPGGPADVLLGALPRGARAEQDPRRGGPGRALEPTGLAPTSCRPAAAARPAPLARNTVFFDTTTGSEPLTR